MPTRDRSLLGVGDERPPQPDDPAAHIAVRVANARDAEVHQFRAHYPGLHGLACDLVGEARADDVVAEAVARCLVRRPLARWDRTDLHHAVVVVAGEHERDGDVAPTIPAGTRRRREPGAATVLAAAHQLIATGRATGPVAPERSRARRGGSVLLAFAVVISLAAAFVAVGLSTNPSDSGPPPDFVAWSTDVVQQAAMPNQMRASIASPPPAPDWWPYDIAFSTIPGIEVPRGALVLHDPATVRRAMLGEVYTITATRGGPAIGYHHQVFGYLPAAIVDAPGFEWATWVAEHNACAPACLPALPDPAIVAEPALPTAG